VSAHERCPAEQTAGGSGRARYRPRTLGGVIP
jgi:hypothetical protein